MSQDPINTAKAQALKESWASVNYEVICYQDYAFGFNDGWDARDEEVKRLREALNLTRQSIAEQAKVDE